METNKQSPIDILINKYEKEIELYTEYDIDYDSEEMYNLSDEDYYSKGEIRGMLNTLRNIVDDLKNITM